MSHDPKDERDELPPLDPRLRWLSEGSLTDEQLGWLRAEAQGDEELQIGLEALAPLDEGLFAGVAEKVYGAPSAPDPRLGGARGRPTRIYLAPALALAAAALLALTNGLARPLPDYQFEWQAGTRPDGGSVVRSVDPGARPDDGARRFRAGDALDLTVRPAVARSGPVRVVVLVDGQAIDAEAQVFPETGTVRVRGQIGAPPWDLAPGAHELTVAVGPARAVSFGSSLLDPRWQPFTVSLVVD